MSRKTRKLMWSVPLIAAVAVIGVLAAYVMLAPGEVQAHPTLPPDPVTGIDVTTPTVADGGRMSLRVTWNAAADGNVPTMYRVDVSEDTLFWSNVIGGERPTDTQTLTEAEAMNDCGADEDGNRCYTVTGLKSNTLYHFRVFAMNDFGTSPISIEKTLGSGTTLPIDPPALVDGLEATDYHFDKIVVTWDEVSETGGADLLWYCLGIASSPSGPFVDLTAMVDDCLRLDEDGAEAADEADIDALLGVSSESQTVVVPAKDEDGDAVTTFTHAPLAGDHDEDEETDDLPDVIELRYRLYAVTDQDGNADTTEDRWISRAASNTATGRTKAPVDKPDSRSEKPGAPVNIRAVAFSTIAANEDGDLPAPIETNQALYFYWTHPANFPEETDTDPQTADIPPAWVLEVQRVVPDEEDVSGWLAVEGVTPPTADAVGYADPQFSVDFNDTDAPTLWGESKTDSRYQIRYVNVGDDGRDAAAAADPNDVEGAWAPITIKSELDQNYFRNSSTPDAMSTLPIILRSTTNGEDPDDRTANGEGLRYTHNLTIPRDRIDLRWTRNMNAKEKDNLPSGYIIDRSEDGIIWQSLVRADSPRDLGTATTFTDSPNPRRGHELVPGKKYFYRVFPVFIQSPDAYGLPAMIIASSRGADHPSRVRDLRVMPDGQTAFDLTWNAPSDGGGHKIEGYLIQWALDDDGDPDGTWRSIAPEDPEDAPLTVKGKDTLEYNYDPDGADALSPGSMRWFRVIAITDENDGADDTGGTVVDVEDGEDAAVQSPEETNGTFPMDYDQEQALPVKKTTDALPRPEDEKDPAAPEKPVDLTAEAASDTNELGDGARGVFLTWNMVESKTASATAAYRVERKRMDTGVAALNDADWVFIGDVYDATSFTDDDALRQDEEVRMYRVGSEATGIDDPEWVEMEVTYALRHPDMHLPSMPQMVTATADSDTEITVSWSTPADNGRSEITGWIVEKAYGGSFLDAARSNATAFTDAQTWWDGLDCPNMVAAVMDDRTADMDNPFCAMYADLDTAEEEEVERVFAARYDIIDDAAKTNATYSDLTPETEYMYRVAAVNAVGLGAWSYKVMATTLATDTMLGNAMDLMMVETDTDPGTIELTWTASANANVHRVAGARKNDDGSFDLTDQVWELVEGDMQNSFTVDGNALNLSPGTYLFAVIAGQRDDSGQTTWSSTWAILDDVDYLQ